MNLMLIPALFCYLLAIYVCTTTILSANGPHQRWIRLSANSALLFHTGWLAQHMLLNNGQDLSAVNVAALLSLLVSLAVTLAAKRFQIWTVLPVVYLFAIITLILAATLPHQYILHLNDQPKTMIHIGFSLAAFAMIMIATVFALQLLYLDWILKRHRPQALGQGLPPLMSVENQLIVLIKVALGLLTLALISGYIFLDDLFADGRAHKVILAHVTWLIYVALLWGRNQYGWRGRIIIYFTISGAVVLNLAYFGSRIVKEIIIQG